MPVLRERHDDFLLVELVKRWEHHKIMNKWMFRFFMYLVRSVSRLFSYFIICSCYWLRSFACRGGRTDITVSITTCPRSKSQVRPCACYLAMSA